MAFPEETPNTMNEDLSNWVGPDPKRPSGHEAHHRLDNWQGSYHAGPVEKVEEGEVSVTIGRKNSYASSVP